jgi:hypothetical protein
MSRGDAQHAGKIPGLLLELPDAILRHLLIDEPALKEHLKEAVRAMQLAAYASTHPAAGEVAAAGDVAHRPGPTGPS